MYLLKTLKNIKIPDVSIDKRSFFCQKSTPLVNQPTQLITNSNSMIQSTNKLPTSNSCAKVLVSPTSV